MSTRTFFDKIIGRQLQRERTALTGYQQLVEAVAHQMEPEVEEVERLLTDSGKTVEDPQRDSERLMRRLGYKDALERLPALHKERAQLDAQIAAADRVLEEAEAAHDEATRALYERRGEIETSIVSYLRQRPSAQIVAAARQLLTQRWWEHGRQNYELVTSQYVLDEARLGDPTLAAERLHALAGIPLLELPPDIPAIASQIVNRGILPFDALVDALHVAVVAFHGVEYPLTWNCKHLANAQVLPKIRDLLLELGHAVPIVCTPEEMVGEE
jgi:hypothetical protein